jgi:hypothetical protein
VDKDVSSGEDRPVSHLLLSHHAPSQRDERVQEMKPGFEVRPGDHACFVVRSDEERHSVVWAVALDAVQRSEKVLCLVDRGAVDDLRAGRSDGMRLRDAWATGQLAVRHVHDVYAPDGDFDPDGALARLRSEKVAALSAGHRQLRVVVDMSWARSGVSHPEELVAFEQRVCEAVTDSKIAAICQYDSRIWNADEGGELVGAHAFELCGSAQTAGSESLLVIETGSAALRLIGELDVLDVSRVTAVDGLTLVAPQPLVQVMLELTHWDRRPGVSIETSP